MNSLSVQACIFFYFSARPPCLVFENMNELAERKRRGLTHRGGFCWFFPPALSLRCYLPSDNITWLLPASFFQGDVGIPSKSSDSHFTAEEGTDTREGLGTPFPDSESAKLNKGRKDSLYPAESLRANT